MADTCISFAGTSNKSDNLEMYKYEKNTMSSKEDFIFSFIHLALWILSVLKYETNKPSSGRKNY